MKALVTGGTGFVGSHVVRELIAQGHEVTVLHRQSSKLTALEGLDYTSASGDLFDVDLLTQYFEGHDWVFHVAAVADYWRADRDWMFKVNVKGTENVFQAAQQAGVKRVIFTSSAAAVGLRDDGKPSDEQMPFNLPPQQFPYGYSKALAERVVKRFVDAGQDIVIVNPVVIMGEGDLNMISGSFVTQTVAYGRLTPITSGGVALVDVTDVARWQIIAADKGQTGERYILGTANYNYRELFDLIADTVGVGRPMIRTPDFILPTVAYFNDRLRSMGIETPIDSDQIRLSSRDVYFDYSKTWSTFGQPQITMPESIRKTYQWYKENGYI